MKLTLAAERDTLPLKERVGRELSVNSILKLGQTKRRLGQAPSRARDDALAGY